MPKALLLSPRGELLRDFLEGVMGRALELEVVPFELAALVGAGRRSRRDLVVLDTVGQNAEGLSMLPALGRAAHPAACVAVVAAGDEPALRQALEGGCEALLVDPFDLAVVRNTLTRIVEHRSSGTREADSLDALAIFLKGVAHEVLNPLTSISGMLQILLHEESEDSEQHGRFETMLKSVERIQNTLRELEHFVRARKPQRRELDAVRLLHELRDGMAREEPPRRVEIEDEAQGAAAMVLGDREQLLGALAHLVRFASSSAPVEPVRIVLRQSNGHAELEIRGTAPTRLPSDPDHLFFPYHVAPDSRAAGSLQLSAAFGIVRSHHGTLSVEQGSEGEAVFRCLLPLSP